MGKRHIGPFPADVQQNLEDRFEFRIIDVASGTAEHESDVACCKRCARRETPCHFRPTIDGPDSEDCRSSGCLGCKKSSVACEFSHQAVTFYMDNSGKLARQPTPVDGEHAAAPPPPGEVVKRTARGTSQQPTSSVATAQSQGKSANVKAPANRAASEAVMSGQANAKRRPADNSTGAPAKKQRPMQLASSAEADEVFGAPQPAGNISKARPVSKVKSAAKPNAAPVIKSKPRQQSQPPATSRATRSASVSAAPSVPAQNPSAGESDDEDEDLPIVSNEQSDEEGDDGVSSEGAQKQDHGNGETRLKGQGADVQDEDDQEDDDMAGNGDGEDDQDVDDEGANDEDEKDGDEQNRDAEDAEEQDEQAEGVDEGGMETGRDSDEDDLAAADGDVDMGNDADTAPVTKISQHSAQVGTAAVTATTSTTAAASSAQARTDTVASKRADPPRSASPMTPVNPTNTFEGPDRGHSVWHDRTSISNSVANAPVSPTAQKQQKTANLQMNTQQDDTAFSRAESDNILSTVHGWLQRNTAPLRAQLAEQKTSYDQQLAAKDKASPWFRIRHTRVVLMLQIIAQKDAQIAALDDEQTAMQEESARLESRNTELLAEKMSLEKELREAKDALQTMKKRAMDLFA